jgi:hypothetical protein
MSLIIKKNTTFKIPREPIIVAANAAFLIIGNVGDGSGTYSRKAGNNSTNLCYGGGSVIDDSSIASNYYYFGPSASQDYTYFDEELGYEVTGFYQCYKYFLFGPNTRGSDYPPTYGQKVNPQGVWKLYKSIQDQSAYTTYELIATNTSSNVNIVPNSNWSPNITITAVPGIPVAGTNQISIGNSPNNGTYSSGRGGEYSYTEFQSAYHKDQTIIFFNNSNTTVVGGDYGTIVPVVPYAWNLVHGQYTDNFVVVTSEANTSSVQTAAYIPTTGWPSITVTI